MAAQEWLREVPNLAGHAEMVSDAMRDRKRLAQLEAVYVCFIHLVEHSVGIVMKAPDVGARQQDERISGAAQIKFWHPAVVYTAKITGGYGGPCSFSGMQHCLSAEKHLPGSIRALVLSPVVGQWFHRHEKLHTLLDRQFDHFVEACAGSEFRRMARRDASSFELQEFDWGQGCGSGNRRTPWIGFRVGQTLLALQQRSGEQDKRRGT